MIEEMYEDTAELALVAAPAASSGTAPIHPQLPLQGASETVQTVMHAVAQNHMFSYYSNMQIAVLAGNLKGPPADPGSSWGLLSMGLADRQRLNFVAMDMLTRRFRERMAGALVTRPVEADRLAEIQPAPQTQPEPQIPVALAIEEVVGTTLEEQPDFGMEL